MFLNQAMQSPVVFEVGDVRLSVPKMTLEDWALFGSTLNAAKEQRLTKDMDEGQRFRYLNFYNVLPIGLGDLQRTSGSPEGISFIIRHCVSKATILARKEGGEWKDVPAPKGKEEKATVKTELAALATAILSRVPHGAQHELTQKIADLFDEETAAIRANA